MKIKALLFTGIMLLILGCTEDIIPITSRSEEARQEYIIARDLIEHVRPHAAVQHLEKAIAMDSTFALAYLYRSFTESNLTEHNRYIEKAKSLIDHVSKGERLCILAYDAQSYGYSRKQEKYLLEMVEIYPNDERALNHLGGYYFGQHDFHKSIVYYKRALEINPQFTPPYNQMGYAFRYLENYSAAEDAFKKYIKLNPDNPNPYDSYAELLLKMGEYDVSIENYEKALEIDPGFTPSHRGIATNLIYMHEYMKARNRFKHLSKIAQNDEQRTTAHFGFATTYIAEGNLEATEREINYLYSLAENNKDLTSMLRNLYLKVIIFYENGRLPEAQKSLDKAKILIDQLDQSSKGRFNLQRAYFYHLTRLMVKKSDFESAEKYVEKYRKIAEESENPLQIKYYNTLMGIISFAKKDYKSALDYFLNSELEDPFNHYWLALVYIEEGKKDKAIQELKEVMHYNGLASLTYMMSRNRAEKLLSQLKMES